MRARLIRYLGALSWVVLAGAGCERTADADRVDGPAFTTYDSAGVTVSLSVDSAWDESSRWSLSSEPVQRIGSVEGPDDAFGRIVSAMRLSDGRVAVADGQARSIKLFSQDGALVRTIGSEGSGPADFSSLWVMDQIRGDSIVASDPSGDRHLVFDAGGRFGRSVPGPRSGWDGLAGVGLVGWFHDGSFLTRATVQVSSLPRGTELATVRYDVFDAEGQHVRTVGELPRALMNDIEGGVSYVALGPTPAVSMDSVGFWFGFPTSYEIEYRSMDGVERVVKRRWRSRSPPEEMKPAYRAWHAEAALLPSSAPASLHELVEATIEGLRFADPLPAFGSVLVATDGHLWVEEYPSDEALRGGAWRPDHTGPSTWTVFDPEGRWLGSVEVPTGVVVRHVSERHLLGTVRDDLGVGYVVVYEILKADDASPSS